MKKDEEKLTKSIAAITAILSELTATSTSAIAGKVIEDKASKQVQFDIAQVDTAAAEVSAIKLQKRFEYMKLNNNSKNGGRGLSVP